MMKDSIHQFNVVDLAEVKTSHREDISSGLEMSTKTMFFSEEYGKVSSFCFNISCVLTHLIVKLNSLKT